MAMKISNQIIQYPFKNNLDLLATSLLQNFLSKFSFETGRVLFVREIFATKLTWSRHLENAIQMDFVSKTKNHYLQRNAIMQLIAKQRKLVFQDPAVVNRIVIVMVKELATSKQENAKENLDIIFHYTV